MYRLTKSSSRCCHGLHLRCPPVATLELTEKSSLKFCVVSGAVQDARSYTLTCTCLTALVCQIAHRQLSAIQGSRRVCGRHVLQCSGQMHLA